MIGKVAGTGNGFKGTVSYLLNGPKNQPKPDRVAWAETRNLLIAKPGMAPQQMRSTAVQSARCKKPVYHLVISWHKDERPSDEVMRRVADATLADLKLAEHQALLVAHAETEHKHLHIVVNRVHPATAKAWHTSNDWPTIEKSLRRQAEAMGMAYVPGRHNNPERFGLVPKAVRDGEYQRAARTGEPVSSRWTAAMIKDRRAELAPLFEQARSWDELSSSLSQRGVGLSRKGQGLVVGDANGFMKLSDLGKGIRLGSLNDRLGETYDSFQARQISPSDRPGAAPGASTSANRTAMLPSISKPAGDRYSKPSSQQLSTDRRGSELLPEAPPSAHSDDTESNPGALTQPVQLEKRQSNWSEDDAAHISKGRASSDNKDKPSLAPKPAEPDPRTVAFADLANAREALDLLHRLLPKGLATRTTLKKAAAEVRRLQAEVDKHLTMREQLNSELRQVLAEKTKAPKPEQRKPDKDDPTDRDSPDMDDDRDR